jgi:hypothetical protein
MYRHVAAIHFSDVHKMAEGGDSMKLTMEADFSQEGDLETVRRFSNRSGSNDWDLRSTFEVVWFSRNGKGDPNNLFNLNRDIRPHDRADSMRDHSASPCFTNDRGIPQNGQ